MMYPDITEALLKAARDTFRPDPSQTVKVRIHFNRFHEGRENKRWHINVRNQSIFVGHWRIVPGVPVFDETFTRKEQPSAFLVAHGRLSVEGDTAVIEP
jgi:hypothetical protein